jgi:broad specificity phosphatase PhoE
VFTSPLVRAQQTAQVIAERVGVTTVEIDDRLRERANWGDVPGQSWDEFVLLWERSNVERDFVVPGGSSARGAGERANAFVGDVAARLPDGEVVAVAHGGLIVDLLLQHFDETELLRREPQLRHMAWCAVTELRVESERATLGCLANWPGGGG